MNRSSFTDKLLSQESSSNFLSWIAFPLLMLVVLGFGWRPLGGGEDFWAHAAIGRWTVEHGHVPNRTLFLWSESIPWIAHAYGTGIIFYGIMRLGGEHWGPYLALAVNVLFSAAPFILLWVYWRKKSPFCSLVPPLFVMAIWVGAARYHPRPELFTAFFMTLLLIFLSQWHEQEKLPRAQIAGVLLMFAIWPNLHGAVAIGLVLLWASGIGEFIQSRDFRLLLLSVVCTLLIFIFNPRGFEYYQVLLPIASKTFQKIDEWKPFWVWPSLAPELVTGEILLWLLGMVIWLTSPNRRLAQLGWMLLMGAAFLKARRQLWLTGLTSLAVIVANSGKLQSDDLFRGWRNLTGGDTTEGIPGPMRLIMRVGVAIVLICAACQAIPRDFLEQGATAKKLPVQMADFLLTKAPKGRILNDYEYSAYLEWAMHERRELYVDLNNAYPDSLMDQYFDIISSSKNPKIMAGYNARRTKILMERKVEIVALRPYTDKEGLSILAKYLDQNPGWERIYKEEDGTVWARKTTES